MRISMRRMPLYNRDGITPEAGRRGPLALAPGAAVHLLRRDEVRHYDLTLFQPVGVPGVAGAARR